jgi:AcrR family transcriptional regulator
MTATANAADPTRVRVLHAASQAFAGEGLSVSLERIARNAGLGAGTVYRHFPSKESLVEAVLVQRLDDMVVRARRWAASAAPGPAFFGFLTDVIRVTGGHQAMCDAFQTDRSWPRVGFTAAGRRFEQALSQLMRAAQRTGEVRTDATLGEVRTLIMGCAVMDRAHHDSGELVRRVLDTLRPSVTEPGTNPVPRDDSAAGSAACAVCGTALRQEPTGRPARYCSAACRQRAHRRRLRALRSR